MFQENLRWDGGTDRADRQTEEQTQFHGTLLVMSKGSAASRCILVPFERYDRPKRCAQKSFWNTFSYIFHLKPKSNIVYECLKTKIFSRYTNILLQMQLFCYNHWGVLGITSLQENGMPKKRLNAALKGPRETTKEVSFDNFPTMQDLFVGNRYDTRVTGYWRCYKFVMPGLSFVKLMIMIEHIKLMQIHSILTYDGQWFS